MEKDEVVENYRAESMIIQCDSRPLRGGTRRGNSSVVVTSVKKTVQAACQVLKPPDVITAGGGVDAGFIGTAGEQLGLAANGSSGQLSLVNTANFDVGVISLDAYGYVGSIPNVTDNAQLGGGFSSLTNFSNHVNLAGQRTGISVGLDDHSKTFTFGASALPFTASFGTSRSAVLFTIPYLGYGLNPMRAACKAVGN